MKVRFSVPAYPRDVFEAEVYDVGITADPETNEIQCWASVPNERGVLRPGYFAKVAMNIDTKEESVVVPLGAVLPTEAGMVAYVIKDEVAQQRKVQTGQYVTGDAVEVLSGLEVGEQLVVEGVESLQDNVPVRVINDRRPAAIASNFDTSGAVSTSRSLIAAAHADSSATLPRQAGKETASQ